MENNHETLLNEETPMVEECSYEQNFESLQTSKISKKEYFQKYAPATFYLGIKRASIIAYVLNGLNIFRIFSSPFALLDIILVLGLILGVHLKKSKACAIIFAIYAAANAVVLSIANGKLMGWMWLFPVVGFLDHFAQAEKAYKNMYQEIK